MQRETVGPSDVRCAIEPADTELPVVDVRMRRVFTIDEFCDAWHLSRSFYYRLRKTGRGPQEIRVGRKIFITVEDARAWEERMHRQLHAGPNQ